jgi:Na+/proline symporter
MLAAKNTKHATLATLLFTVLNYAVRPWPWIIIGLASLVIFPDLSSLAAAFPNLDESYIKNDLAYAAMLSYLPSGLLGLVVTSLIAAFMSTISTHLNWGSSYVVNDFYVRFLKPDASEFNKVLVGRLSTLVLMICSALLALVLEEAKEAFDLLLQIGAGTGLLFILRWFWNRINPYSEIAAMLSSFIIAAVFFIGKSYALWDIESYVELIFGVVVTTIVWVLVSLLTKPTDKGTIKAFEERIFEGSNKYKNFKYKFIGFACGVCGVYAALFATGYLIYKDFLLFAIASSICLLSTGILIANWKRIIN